MNGTTGAARSRSIAKHLRREISSDLERLGKAYWWIGDREGCRISVSAVTVMIAAGKPAKLATVPATIEPTRAIDLQ